MCDLQVNRLHMHTHKWHFIGQLNTNNPPKKLSHKTSKIGNSDMTNAVDICWCFKVVVLRGMIGGKWGQWGRHGSHMCGESRKYFFSPVETAQTSSQHINMLATRCSKLTVAGPSQKFWVEKKRVRKRVSGVDGACSTPTPANAPQIPPPPSLALCHTKNSANAFCSNLIEKGCIFRKYCF